MSNSILTGMGKILNGDNVNKRINIDELERSVQNIQPIPVQKVNNFTEQLEKIAAEVQMEKNSILNAEPVVAPVSIYDTQPSSNYGMETETNEQRKYDKFKNVMNDMGVKPVNYSLEAEKKEDMKSSMLEEIDFLREELIEYGYAIERIGSVTYDSPYEIIESTLRLLRHKMDRVTYCEFAESFILMGAYGLEDIFDGKKSWFGYSPDLTGWPDSVNLKLRRMRLTTSQVVSQMVYDYGVSPTVRLALELIPSAVLHSRMRKNEVLNSTSNKQYIHGDMSKMTAELNKFK